MSTNFNFYSDINLNSDKNFFKNIFPYNKVPKIIFLENKLKLDLQKDIFVTDTTFRDGQQSMSSFSVNDIVSIFDNLHRLDNNNGIIRFSEFFLYTKKDRDAIKKCLDRNYKYPIITAWIRANKNDLAIVKDLKLKETGILMSCSDYHIYEKLNLNRKEAMKKYISIAKEAFESGITPRCHLEDITRADIKGFVIPLVQKLQDVAKSYDKDIKIRACDTLGLGLPYKDSTLPRSVPKIISYLKNKCNLKSKNLEWHGHNDFYKSVINSTTAWLYGAGAVNTTLFGIGERTGNTPLEAMLFEYLQLNDNMEFDFSYLNNIKNIFENKLNYKIPPKTPFVGSEFNLTKAGIHADGILKNEEIYNSFDTRKILKKPPVVAINEYSGLSGIAAWINNFFLLESKINKKDKRLLKIKEFIDTEYKNGRKSCISNEELKNLTINLNIIDKNLENII